MGRDYCSYCERVGCEGDCLESRLEFLYDAAVELMLPHATTDILGDLKRLRQHIVSGAGPANGNPFHVQLLDTLIDETMLRLKDDGFDYCPDCGTEVDEDGYAV